MNEKEKLMYEKVLAGKEEVKKEILERILDLTATAEYKHTFRKIRNVNKDL
jgi:hypothetical protein